MCDDEEIPGYGRLVSMKSVGEKIKFKLEHEAELRLVEAETGEDDYYVVDYNNFLMNAYDVLFRFVPPNVPNENISLVDAFNYQRRVWGIHDRAIIAFLSEPDETETDTVFESRLYPLDWGFLRGPEEHESDN